MSLPNQSDKPDPCVPVQLWHIINRHEAVIGPTMSKCSNSRWQRSSFVCRDVSPHQLVLDHWAGLEQGVVDSAPTTGGGLRGQSVL